jgi:hypothetical protein
MLNYDGLCLDDASAHHNFFDSSYEDTMCSTPRRLMIEVDHRKLMLLFLTTEGRTGKATLPYLRRQSREDARDHHSTTSSSTCLPMNRVFIETAAIFCPIEKS